MPQIKINKIFSCVSAQMRCVHTYISPILIYTNAEQHTKSDICEQQLIHFSHISNSAAISCEQ